MKSRIRQILPAAAVAVLLGILIITGIYKCPSDFFLGIPCPLCGITRAFKAVLSGDPAAAFYYHPLWPVITVYGILYLLTLLKVISPSRRLIGICGYLLCFLLVTCFIIRHITGSPIVKLHFESSFIHTAWDFIN